MFRNEPALEMRRASVRARATDALQELDGQLPMSWDHMVASGTRSGPVRASVDPGTPERIVVEGTTTTTDDVSAAVADANEAQREWGARSGLERAAVLERAAAVLREQRLTAAALALRECGKPWGEADADVAEAIDFLEYYALGAVELDRGRPLLQLPGERNDLRYVARGVAAVIAPWNFPLAIATGMTSAALAAGNAVLLKPAEQAPGCAALVVAALHAAGVPEGVLQFLPGGDDVGRALVASAGVHTIAFTGSCAAGLQIMERAAVLAPGQRHIKRVIAEMGGKNCIIVDRDADLDDVVPGVLTSAFAFAGQKCSAASRVLVHEDIADTLIERLRGAMETLQVGPADEFATDVPPVIDEEARARIAEYIEAGGAPAGVAPAGPSTGFYVTPTMFADLAPDSPVITDEIFGPVLSVERVASVAAACDRVDGSQFALTGGIFSRSPATIAEVARRTPVGNLYVNRDITGAMVARQPFGGGRLSGTGPKAGGPDYLLSFVEARARTENTVRHGLVV